MSVDMLKWKAGMGKTLPSMSVRRYIELIKRMVAAHIKKKIIFNIYAKALVHLKLVAKRRL